MKTLNEKQLEMAARNLCGLRNINPEMQVQHSPPPNANGSIPAVLVSSPAWKILAAEIKAHDECTVAIGMAVEQDVNDYANKAAFGRSLG